MMLNLLKGKIHCATVTEANLQYMGSITIDEELMEQAGILPNERVQVVDNNNGARLETYTIPGPRGSGVVCLNGAAARCVQPGDVVIIMAYAFFSEEEARGYQPLVVMVDEKNKVREVRRVEYHGQTA
ncbi:MAG: aspartate 1-decarboxylase [Selenomonadaceae bacterium]|nr:aspartate 1-decarboxylase [Selenomonadaceae bacterium]MBQ1510456.1 aspartate 1-decarboxylase [Selenomonadaceae bacterium]MBQ1915560.1 aspartate 1-decarboxylase [Selenomonadaceae bacterium]MBQ3972510.1 aspartate 1-decarboxylase [Selenomonadaceae bacterium]